MVWAAVVLPGPFTAAMLLGVSFHYDVTAQAKRTVRN